MQSLLITIDALRADHLGQYGYERKTMPALDELERSGRRFTQAYANAPFTALSVPSILSSQYLGRENLETDPTIGTALADAGITTGAFHSNTWLSTLYDSIDGFDTYVDFYDVEAQADDAQVESLSNQLYWGTRELVTPVLRKLNLIEAAKKLNDWAVPPEFVHDFSAYVSAEETTKRATEWIKDHRTEDFFLWVHYMDPHRPYGLNYEQPTFGNSITPARRQKLMAKMWESPERVTRSESQQLQDLYDSDLRYTSQHLETLFSDLKNMGLWEDAQIVLTADHGEEFQEHGLYEHRNKPYDELLHVPLYVKDPAKGDRAPIHDQRELVDIAPTICDFFGVDAPNSFVGTPLNQGEPRDVIARGCLSVDGTVVACRKDGWKCIFVDGEPQELYEIRSDPGEEISVCDDNPDILRRCKEAVPDDVFNTTPDLSVSTDEDDVEQRLEALGYV